MTEDLYEILKSLIEFVSIDNLSKNIVVIKNLRHAINITKSNLCAEEKSGNDITISDIFRPLMPHEENAGILTGKPKVIMFLDPSDTEDDTPEVRDLT